VRIRYACARNAPDAAAAGRSAQTLDVMSRYVRPPPDSPSDVVWVAGGEVDEYRISLGFYGDQLDPNELSRLLGALPTSHCRKGDVAVGKHASRLERTGRWLLAMPVQVGEPLEPQLRRLLSALTPDLSVWRSITDRYKTRFVICAWVRSWNRGLEIDPAIVREISDRGLGIGVDIYVDDEKS
jgi:hypothetical protein